MDIKNSIDTIKLINDISEWKTIYSNYKLTGFLDRDHVIKKILDKRREDPKIALLTNADQMGKPTLPIEMVSNESLIHEVELQIVAMESELAEKAEW